MVGNEVMLRVREGEAETGQCCLHCVTLCCVCAEAAFVKPTSRKQLLRCVPERLQKGNTHPSQCHLETDPPVSTLLYSLE